MRINKITDVSYAAQVLTYVSPQLWVAVVTTDGNR